MNFLFNKSMVAMRTLFIFLPFFFFFSSHHELSNQKKIPKIFVREKRIMGTLARIRVEESENFNQIKWSRINEAFHIMEELDSLLSIYLPDSQVSLLNKNSFLDHAHFHLLELIKKSLAIEEETEGAFDITLAALTMKAYHFNQLNEKSSENLSIPRSRDIERFRQFTGSKYIEIHPPQVRILKRGVGLDFGGIAKGYAVDQASLFLEREGLQKGEVSLSGDIRCFGECLLWIEHPLKKNHLMADLRIKEKQIGISTSGGYGRFAGQPSFHHILDPQSGQSASYFLSVTLAGVFSNTELDAWATAISVMKPEKAELFLNQKPLLGYFIVSANREIKTNFSKLPWVNELRVFPAGQKWNE